MCYDWIGPRKANGFVPAQVGARTPSLNQIGNMSRLLLTVGAVIVAVGLAVTALLAQDDLDATRQAAEQGDPVAKQVVRQVIENIGRGLASILAVLDPDGIIVGGGVVHSLESRWHEVIDAVRTYGLPRYEARGVPVSITKLGDDVSLIGASVLSFNRFGRG